MHPFQKPFIFGNGVIIMIGEILESIGFEQVVDLEGIEFARRIVEEHLAAGYRLRNYYEINNWGVPRLHAELEGSRDILVVEASPELGVVISRIAGAAESQ